MNVSRRVLCGVAAAAVGSSVFAQATNGSGIDSRFVARAFEGTWLAVDYNGDTVVTDIDAAMKVHGAISHLIGTDANGDGVVSAGDLAWLVTRVMSSSRG